APHLAEELWRLANSKIKDKESIFIQPWPAYDKNFINADSIEYVAQVNGKLRDRFVVSASASEEEVKDIALKSEKIKNFISDKKILKIIFVPKRLINFVVS
ncbi:MAG: class I tRNA ligase family protein, partial [Patescibacteria group bacterium]